ncbi:MAG TPA: protein-L-isoaspartate(D-aspartate) O-methyltransferase [Candidatus Omnitrophica bacterium]|nr:protein-L-isoaspartate(D-aspartate) O-methyltransferase [Candidatus Omnitrophota bacterium]
MNFDRYRKEMVETQIKRRGIDNPRVLRAMLNVPRHVFVPANFQKLAYSDQPLPVGEGQTISQPYMVAVMTASLDPQPHDRVLEIGTGSGYQAAILAELCREVYTVERIPQLSIRAQEIIRNLGYKNVFFKIGDGSEGWPEFAPYDKIIVTAGAPQIPQPLIQQLKLGGRMVIPVGDRLTQELKLIYKHQEGVKIEDVCGCVFVPLLGKYAWEGEQQ